VQGPTGRRHGGVARRQRAGVPSPRRPPRVPPPSLANVTFCPYHRGNQLLAYLPHKQQQMRNSCVLPSAVGFIA
jgi:hypothetical protein